jgi:hypothetical protein
MDVADKNILPDIWQLLFLVARIPEQSKSASSSESSSAEEK